MANLTIVTPCRDFAGPLYEQYRRQIDHLEWERGSLLIVMVEGDSIDETPQMLAAWERHEPRVRVITHNTGKRRFPSEESAERFEHLSGIITAGLDAVDLYWSDYVLMLPSDIKFEPDMAQRLVAWDKDIIAPMVWMDGWFYDTWAFRYPNGGQFAASQHLWHSNGHPTDPFEMQSVGGTNMINAEVLRAGCQYTPEAVDVGLCAWARELGFHVWADPTTDVDHVREAWRAF